jgi:hypothetical protein
MRGVPRPAMLYGMSSPKEPYTDPSGNTEAFQAFVNRGGTPIVKPGRSRPTGLIIGAVVVVVIVVAVVVWLAVS